MVVVFSCIGVAFVVTGVLAITEIIQLDPVSDIILIAVGILNVALAPVLNRKKRISANQDDMTPK